MQDVHCALDRQGGIGAESTTSPANGYLLGTRRDLTPDRDAPHRDLCLRHGSASQNAIQEAPARIESFAAWRTAKANMSGWGVATAAWPAQCPCPEVLYLNPQYLHTAAQRKERHSQVVTPVCRTSERCRI
jgi:hypothetical protein